MLVQNPCWTLLRHQVLLLPDLQVQQWLSVTYSVHASNRDFGISGKLSLIFILMPELCFAWK
jgi:hypothetical protein